MIYYNTTHADVAESFLLGLSCLVGGDQFFILVSKTDASPKTQSYIAIITVLSTLFLAFVLYDEYNRSLFDVTHVLYLVLLVIWGLILYQNVKNPFVTTYYTSMLGMVMTFLVIISCVHYSHQKDLLASFLSGMLFARLLPTILWIFVHQKKAESKSNLGSLSARLALFRLVFCIISMILKFTSGNLDFSQISFYVVKSGDRYLCNFISKYGFLNLFEHFKKMFEQFKKSSNNIYSILYIIVLITSSLFLFIFSIVLYLALPPIVYKFSHLYSHHLYSRIDIIKTLSHILGVALGTKYPASKTVNSHYFPNIFLGYGVYFFGSPIVNNRCKFTSRLHLYIIVVLNGFVLGYVWSYSLVIITNIFFVKTCVYEENVPSPCCGDKTESQCYCKLPSIIEKLNKPTVTCYTYATLSYLSFTYGLTCKYLNRFECSKSFEHINELRESFNYHPNGPNAILLFYNETDCSSIKSLNGCSDVCSDRVCYCFNLFGIYKIQSVTTSTCENCQLTIRIEAKSICCKNGSCSGGSNGECCCNGQDSKCCCLVVKCCDSSRCSGNCCCLKVCACKNCGSCLCKIKSKINMTRLFICFKNSTKTCIKEIRINSTPFFDADLTTQNQFYIKSIDFSDCCHVDLKVDLQCTMKNNFFRLTPINYPKKTIKPVELMLCRDDSECCGTKTPTCCCIKNLDLSKVILKYEHEVDLKKSCVCPKNCNSTCRCCTDGNCCCCVTCTLNVNRLTSFYDRIEPVRVKLVIVLWFFFLLSLMIAIASESRDKNKILKYYQFFPIRSFQTVNKELESNGMNSMHQVLERLRSVQQNIFLQLFGEKDKKTDLEHMFQLCSCAFDPCSLNSLRHYVLSKSSMLIASPQYINRRLNLELVKWSYCVGFVYTYIMLMFFRIQEYFLKWEQVWRMEYLNYTRIMKKKFNNLTNKSKSSMSLACEKGVNHKTTLYTDTSKKGGWDCSHDELDIHANLNERETEMNKDPPYRLDLRLVFYLDKWKHRVENLIFWTENETNVYDWTVLIKEYPGIRSWFFKFLPHIQAASHDLDIPIEKINKGTEILHTKNLSLIS